MKTISYKSPFRGYYFEFCELQIVNLYCRMFGDSPRRLHTSEEVVHGEAM